MGGGVSVPDWPRFDRLNPKCVGSFMNLLFSSITSTMNRLWLWPEFGVVLLIADRGTAYVWVETTLVRPLLHFRTWKVQNENPNLFWRLGFLHRFTAVKLLFLFKLVTFTSSLPHFLTYFLLFFSSWVWFSWSEFSWIVEVKGSPLRGSSTSTSLDFLNFPVFAVG